MKQYSQPKSEVIELQIEKLIATSGGNKVGVSDKFADNNTEALSSKKNPIWN